MNQQKSIEELISLKGKTAIVTGGAMGIGLGIARRLHEAGASVVIADVDGKAGEEVVKELNASRSGSALFSLTDVSKEEDVRGALEKSIATFGGVDILVNNAGIFPFASLSSMGEADFAEVMRVNLHGLFLFTKHVSEHMKKRGKGGNIINVTSIDAIHPSMVGLAHYDASKHGVWGFTKNIALELAPHGIRVNALAPGGILTPGVKAISGNSIDQFSATIPAKRLGDPDEMGRVALFLATDLSSYVIGSQIVADGGALLS